MVELVQKRTLNGKVFMVGENQKRYDFHVRPIHFESGGQLVDIDPTITDNGDTLSTMATPYAVDIKKTVNELDSLFSFTLKNKSIGFIPRGLRWDNGEVIHQDASGSTNASGSVLGALGVFGDIHIQPNAIGVRKLIEIKELPQVPGGVEYLEVGFELVATDGFEFWYEDSNKSEVALFRAQLQALNSQRTFLEGRRQFQQARLLHKKQQELEEGLHDAKLSKWDKTTDTRFSGEWQIRINGVKIYGRSVHAWHSTENKKIEVDLRLRNGKFYFTKLIPVGFLGVYPLFTDATTSYYAGSGDGYVARTAGATWTAARDTADGTENNETGTSSSEWMDCTKNGLGQYRNYRFFFPSNTSAIDDGDTITGATFNWYFSTGTVSNTDSCSIVLVETSQASTTALENTDYNNFTNTSIGSQTFASLSGTGYKTITITDLTKISKTGTTMIGAINSLDLNNSAPTGFNYLQSIEMSESSGTSSDPYYSITSTPPFTSNKQLLLLGAGT